MLIPANPLCVGALRNGHPEAFAEFVGFYLPRLETVDAVAAYSVPMLGWPSQLF